MTQQRNFHAELSAAMEAYPDLVFMNHGYERLPDPVIEANKEGISRVEEILSVAVADFVCFQNFKPRKDGSIAVRCQTMWAPWFQGVSYFPLDDFTPENMSEHMES